MSVTITNADASDLGTLADLHRQCFAAAWSTADFARLLAMPGTFALLAREGEGGGAWTGFILARQAADEAEILSIGTRPAWRRSGVAEALLAHAFDRLAGDGATAVFIEVDAANAAARRLYDKSGFVEVGRRAGYYAASAGTPGDAIVMRRPLAGAGAGGGTARPAGKVEPG